MQICDTTSALIWLALSLITFVLLKPWKPTKSRRALTVGDLIGSLFLCCLLGPFILGALLMDVRLSE